MIEAGLAEVEFVVVNTDSQDLSASNADRRILIGDQSTENLGTGGNPRLGERAANESYEDLSDLVFQIVSGMCMGVLTALVALVVVEPFVLCNHLAHN